MIYVFRLFIKRIPREGFKSLTVPVLALVLIVLINIMGGVRQQQAADLEDVTDNFEVRVEISDPVSSARDDLGITNDYMILFTDEDAIPSLAKFLKDVELKRSMRITVGPPVPYGKLIGITSVAATDRLDPLAGAYIAFFDGYDESVFRSNDCVCVVSEQIYNALDPEEMILYLSVQSEYEPDEIMLDSAYESGEIMLEDAYVPDDISVEFKIAGIVHGAGNDVFCPFWVAGELGSQSDGFPTHTDSMSALMADNRLINGFKNGARQHFARPGDVDAKQPYSLTVFDGVYNEVTKKLMQNIRMIDVATPFIYIISVCIGFVASYLLTRRRKPEFAVLRSVGVNKRDVFFGALAEQAVLCVSGVAAGCALFFTVYGFIPAVPPVVFTLCYTLGSAISAERAAGTDVLKILREKE